MNKKRIYLAGGISGLSIEEHNSWRLNFQELLNKADIYWVNAFNPVDHIEEINPDRMGEREAMDYDLMMLRDSDLVVMNFNNPLSIGTACELGIAYENRIPVLGLNLENKELHPWQECICTKVFNSWSSFIGYFINHYASEWL